MSSEWRLRTRSLSLAKPLVMGIVNVTPDSFSDGGAHPTPEAAISHGLRLAAEGADVIDVGGESTRPGAAAVDAATEMGRVLEVVAELAGQGHVVSIDTTKPEVAEAALTSGAEIVNDVTGASDPDMRALLVSTGAGSVIMHMQGTPRTMQANPHYEDVVSEVTSFLVERGRLLIAMGVDDASIVVDPGIGFGKTTVHNLELLNGLGVLVATEFPVCVGASRKSFLSKLTGSSATDDRDIATVATTAVAVTAGAAMVRVHAVAPNRRAAQVAWALARARARTPG